jgi:hypothetical protein
MTTLRELSAGWPILNFAPFAKFRVGTFEALQSNSVAWPIRAVLRLEWGSSQSQGPHSSRKERD